jgi:hypothetical protein
MVLKDDNQISSQLKSYQSREIIKMADVTSKFVVYVNQGGDNPWDDIPLHVGAESRKYFHVRLENIHKSYSNSGVEKLETHIS